MTNTIDVGGYAEFCRDKLDYSYVAGFPCELDEIHPSLMPHQRAIVRWAVEGGRRAIFAAFGLGKTRMALETVRLTLAKSGGRRGLIICPLGVRQEFRIDGAAIGMHVTFIRRTEEIPIDGSDRGQVYLTNYESIRDGRLDRSCSTSCHSTRRRYCGRSARRLTSSSCRCSARRRTSS